MSGKVQQLKQLTTWRTSFPVLRFSVGSALFMAVITLWDYPMAYVAPVLALSFIGPGSKPLPLKVFLKFIILNLIVNIFMLLFSEVFLDYPLVFYPLQLLIIFWLYYTDKIPVVLKLFFAISIVVIPLSTLFYKSVGYFIAIILVTNYIVAILMSYIVFFIFPWTKYDERFVPETGAIAKQSEKQRFIYARNIIIVLAPVLMFFYMYELVSASLVLIYIMILTITPAFSSAKAGMFTIAANIIGGISAILAYKLLIVVPFFSFMVLLIVSAGMLFGMKVFEKSVKAAVYKSSFSTFLLILGMVITSDSNAGEEVWNRVFLISVAIIYVVFTFRILKYFTKRNAVQASV